MTAVHASDPPAWGVVPSRLEEASRASPPPDPGGGQRAR